MTLNQKVAVIGLGTVGAQILLELARRGITTHGYEKNAPGHDLGAAGGGSRLYRKVLFDDSRYWPLSQLADEKWNQLEKDSKELLRHNTGSLLLGPADHPQMQAATAHIDNYDVAAEKFETIEARERFPHFHFDDGDEAIFDNGAAIIRPERTIRTAVHEAVRLGAEITLRTSIQSVAEDANGVTLTAQDGRSETYDAAVVATGPWNVPSGLLPAGSIQIKRPVSGWYLLRSTRGANLDYGFIRTGPEHFYGVGALDQYEIKIGLSASKHLSENEPEKHNPIAAPEEIQPLNEVARKYLPGLDPEPVRSHAYMEAYSADGHPLVGLAPGRKRVVLATGFSGKGFKFAPAIGAVVADIAESGSSRCPVALLDPARAALLPAPQRS